MESTGANNDISATPVVRVWLTSLRGPFSFSTILFHYFIYLHTSFFIVLSVVSWVVVSVTQMPGSYPSKHLFSVRSSVRKRNPAPSLLGVFT